MKTSNRLTRIVLASAIALSVSCASVAQMAVFDPINFIETFMTAAQTLESNVQQAQQIQTQLSQYRNMLQNTASLSNQDWSTASSELSRLADIAQQGQALSYASQNIDSKFRSLYPGYAPATNYGTSYQQWTQSSLDSMRGAMNTAGLQHANLATETSTIESLRSAAAGADGQKAAIDAGNQIAFQQVAQLQQLRQLTMAQMQSQTAYQAQQVQDHAANQAAASATMQYVDPKAGYTPASIKPAGTN
jgi:P-type conjugative transfer protein TrbJ